jgi:hypothetical protein
MPSCSEHQAAGVEVLLALLSPIPLLALPYNNDARPRRRAPGLTTLHIP